MMLLGAYFTVGMYVPSVINDIKEKRKLILGESLFFCVQARPRLI